MKTCLGFIAVLVLVGMTLFICAGVFYDHARACRIDSYAESFAWRCQ